MSEFEVRRANFVDGMLLIAEDLSQEQSYFDRRLQQLAAQVGWGVVKGLEVAIQDTNLVINPGYAFDQQGREIVLDESFVDGKPGEGVVSIRRAEPKPVTASEIARSRSVSSTEGAVVRKVEQASVEIRAWRNSQDLEDGWVPLARIARKESGFTVSSVRRLTTISSLSWKHADSGPADCWIEFSAPVRNVPANALDVRVRGSDGTETIVAVEPKSEDAGTKYCFRIDPGPRKHDKRHGRTVFIRLACDFVLDWKGDPVSGAHLRGRPPSGNGVPGGLFESWFSIAEQTA